MTRAQALEHAIEAVEVSDRNYRGNDACIAVLRGMMEEQASDPALFSAALRAICLTRDYVGESLLPPKDGWEWFEAGKKLAARIPEDQWARDFWARVNQSPEALAYIAENNAEALESTPPKL